jgi:membrane protease YdiL (CAAX protease family)
MCLEPTIDIIRNTEPAVIIPPQPTRLRVGPAAVVVLAYLGIQLVTGVVVVIAVTLMGVFQGLDLRNPEVMDQVIQSTMAPTVIFGMLLSGMAMIAISVLWFRQETRDRGPGGAAWVIGEGKHLISALIVGLLLACAFVALAPLLLSNPDESTLGPLAKMAHTPGLQRIAWLVVAVLLAPPIEELLFRGVMYGGIRRSWGPTWAAVLTTGLFVSLHIGEMLAYWPALISITGMAVAALWFRIKTRAIGPSIAVHLAYNSVLAVIFLCA